MDDKNLMREARRAEKLSENTDHHYPEFYNEWIRQYAIDLDQFERCSENFQFSR